MYKKFEINRTKIKGGHISKSDLPLYRLIDHLRDNICKHGNVLEECIHCLERNDLENEIVAEKVACSHSLFGMHPRSEDNHPEPTEGISYTEQLMSDIDEMESEIKLSFKYGVEEHNDCAQEMDFNDKMAMLSHQQGLLNTKIEKAMKRLEELEYKFDNKFF